MFGPYWIPSREDVVTKAKKDIVMYAMSKGYDIVVDNMNLNPREVKFWEDIVKEHNVEGEYKYEIEFKDFFISVEECIRRDAMRPNPIGEKVIRETWKRYKHFIQTTLVEKYVDNIMRYTGKPKCIVIDMDSTMCFNTTKRPWFGEGAAEGMVNDVPNGCVCDVILELQKSYPIVLATGRDTSQEEVTRKWLSQHRIDPVKYYFRTEGDYRKGTEIKKEQIDTTAKTEIRENLEIENQDLNSADVYESDAYIT